MSAWKPAGYPSMSPYRICKHGNFIIFRRFDSVVLPGGATSTSA
jgi:hypothetical protein